jgi:hypothetical protein
MCAFFEVAAGQHLLDDHFRSPGRPPGAIPQLRFLRIISGFRERSPSR